MKLTATALCTVLCFGGSPASAQDRPQATRDSGRVVLSTILGGDSGQATLVQLRRGTTYLVSVQPPQSDVIIRQTARGNRAGFTLDAPSAAVAVPDGRAFTVVPRESGEHLVELTNPQVGATRVGITFMRLADSDTLSTRDLACSRDPESQACVKPKATSRLGLWLALASIPIVRFVLLR